MELTTRQEINFFNKIKFTLKGCWLWTDALKKNGYGQFNTDSGPVSPHRVSYEYFIGPIPEDLTIDHLCRNRACVNPAHLEAVTAGENSLRGEGVGAKNKEKTHCSKGHPFTWENTAKRLKKNGGVFRICRTCESDNSKRYLSKKKAQQTERLAS